MIPCSASELLIVFYDVGPVGPYEIAREASESKTIIFVVGNSEHTAAMRPILERLGRVIDWTSVDRVSQQISVAGTPRGVVCFSELMLMPAAQTAEELSLPFNSPKTVERLLNKDLQRQALNQDPSLAVKFVRLSEPSAIGSALARVGTPAVFKPVRGRGSRDTYTVHTRDDVLRCWDRAPGSTLSDFQVEEFIGPVPRDDVSDSATVETLSVGGHRNHLAIGQRFPIQPPFRGVGHYWGPLSNDVKHALEQATTQALDNLGVTDGMTQTELKYGPRGAQVLEVNGRMGGMINTNAEAAFGTNFTRLSIDAACTREVPDAWPRELDTYFSVFSNLAPGRASRLVDIDGYERVRALDGVRYVRRLCATPSNLEQDGGTHELDIIASVGLDRESMLAALRRAASDLEFTFEDHNGLFQCSGIDLPSYRAISAPQSLRSNRA